ncbi:hypothetical protein C8J56DRAFT_593017 [Mycena floridula]|nr:hypothetical protein C8J56DRAFT_593017 [Mycena floridula]
MSWQTSSAFDWQNFNDFLESEACQPPASSPGLNEAQDFQPRQGSSDLADATSSSVDLDALQDQRHFNLSLRQQSPAIDIEATEPRQELVGSGATHDLLHVLENLLNSSDVSPVEPASTPYEAESAPLTICPWDTYLVKPAVPVLPKSIVSTVDATTLPSNATGPSGQVQSPHEEQNIFASDGENMSSSTAGIDLTFQGPGQMQDFSDDTEQQSSAPFSDNISVLQYDLRYQSLLPGQRLEETEETYAQFSQRMSLVHHYASPARQMDQSTTVAPAPIASGSQRQYYWMPNSMYPSTSEQQFYPHQAGPVYPPSRQATLSPALSDLNSSETYYQNFVSPQNPSFAPISHQNSYSSGPQPTVPRFIHVTTPAGRVDHSERDAELAANKARHIVCQWQSHQGQPCGVEMPAIQLRDHIDQVHLAQGKAAGRCFWLDCKKAKQSPKNMREHCKEWHLLWKSRPCLNCNENIIVDSREGMQKHIRACTRRQTRMTLTSSSQPTLTST